MPLMKLPALLIALASLASGQDQLILQRGDPVSGMPGTTISAISGHGIASTGDWWAVARFTAPSPDGEILVINGVTEYKFGDVIEGNRSFSRGRRADFTAAGDVAVHCSALEAGTSGSLDVILWNGAISAITGQAIVDATGAPLGTIDRIEEFVLDGDDRILARVSIAPFSIPFETVLVEIDPTAGAAHPAVLLLGPGAPYPDGSEVQTVERVDVNARGDVMTAGKERLGATGSYLRGVRVNGALRARTGDIEPTTGATWNLEGPVFTITTVAFDLDAQGEVVIYGRLEAAGGSTRAIVRDSTVVARTGQAPLGSSIPLRQIDPYGMAALPDGRVFWSGFEQGSSEKILFLGNQRYLQIDDEILGSTVTDIVQFSNVDIQPFSENGGFFLHRVSLDDGRIGLLRRSLSIGRFGCPQQIPNSSGRVARLEARGSDLAGGHDLVLAATDLPSSKIGIFVVGSSAGQTSIPGSQGRICVSGAIGRFGDVFQANAAGAAAYSVDTSALPIGAGSGRAVMPGETWHFQGWFRDDNPFATSNLTDSVLVTFR